MELKQTKPIHLKCPKCGYDFAYNTNHIEEEIDSLKKEIASVIGRLKKGKESYCCRNKITDQYHNSTACRGKVRKRDNFKIIKRSRRTNDLL